MKHRIFTTWMVMMCLFALLSACKKVDNKASSNTGESKFSNVVEDVETRMYEDKISNLEEMTLQDYKSILKNKVILSDEYFYFGRKSCPVCRNFVLSIKNFDSIDNLFYIDTESMTKKDKDELKEMKIEAVPAIFKIDITGKAIPITTTQFLKGVE